MIWCLSFFPLFISVTSSLRDIFSWLCQKLSLKFWIKFIYDFSIFKWFFWTSWTYWACSFIDRVSSWLNYLCSYIINFFIWNSLVRTFDTSLNLLLDTLRLPSFFLIVSC
jgi:hypothetical protein